MLFRKIPPTFLIQYQEVYTQTCGNYSTSLTSICRSEILMNGQSSVLYMQMSTSTPRSHAPFAYWNSHWTHQIHSSVNGVKEVPQQAAQGEELLLQISLKLVSIITITIITIRIDVGTGPRFLSPEDFRKTITHLAHCPHPPFLFSNCPIEKDFIS